MPINGNSMIDQSVMTNGREFSGGSCIRSLESKKPLNKFGGVWLPVPTILGLISTIFWTWLLLNTVGYEEKRLEKTIERIIERF